MSEQEYEVTIIFGCTASSPEEAMKHAEAWAEHQDESLPITAVAVEGTARLVGETAVKADKSGNGSRKLYKTTIVIWSEENPDGVREINDLAQQAMDGDSYCSKSDTVGVDDPMSDPDWDGTEFFNGGTEFSNDGKDDE